MEGYSRKDDECHQFLDLIPKEREFIVNKTRNGLSDEKKLELRLGPPGGEWTVTDNNNSGSQREDFSFGFSKSPWLLHLQSSHPVMNEPSQPCTSRVAPANTAVPNSSTAQKRTAPAPVVGWPPIRSFRKNLANGGSSKTTSDSADVVPNKVCSQKPIENYPKSLFVKINMDGIPIGRKVDLRAYDSYEKLSCAVDELFRGLLAAQNDSTVGGIKDKEDGLKMNGGILDVNGEYTLVYEDNEGARMLVGDVPWHMFVSTVKKLRVLKSSELPKLSHGNKHGKSRS